MDRPGWDGATWSARAVLAVVPILATAGLAVELRPVVVAASVWLVLVTATDRLRRQRPSAVQHLLNAAVDVLALSVLVRLAPELAPTGVVLLAVAGVLHASAGATWTRVTAALLAVAAQLAVPALDAGLVRLLVVVDLSLLVTGAVLLSRQEQHRRRSTAALQRADQLTDAVLAGIGEAVVVTDDRGRVVSTNDAAAVTFGTTDGLPTCGALGLFGSGAPLDCSRSCALLPETTTTAQAEVSRDHPSGVRQALLVNVRALQSATGRVRQVVHSYRDVSALKQADRAKTLFLATTSHELKTPVAVISGYAELLANPQLREAHGDEAVEKIRARATQLSRIIDRLLLTSRIEDGHLALDTARVELAPLAEERVQALRGTTDRELVVDVPHELPAAHGSTDAVATVLEHLVENALKYSPGGGPVTITAEADDRRIALDVTDHGIGMSSVDAEHCFDPFWQAEGDDTRRFDGTGVGLYIVRSLARAMGGDAHVHQSRPGQGTTMRLELQRHDVATAVAPHKPEPTDEAPMIGEFMRQVGVGGDR